MQKSLEEIKGIYIHYKDPTKEYELYDVAFHTGNHERVVLYRALYEVTNLPKNDYGHPMTFARPWEVFFSTVEVEGKIVERFKKIR